jgi:hypothetical protein
MLLGGLSVRNGWRQLFCIAVKGLPETAHLLVKHRQRRRMLEDEAWAAPREEIESLSERLTRRDNIHKSDTSGPDR